MVADPTWCGTVGCLTFILKHERGQWICLTETNMHETVRVLDEKRNGWHRLIAGRNVSTRMRQYLRQFKQPPFASFPAG